MVRNVRIGKYMEFYGIALWFTAPYFVNRARIEDCFEPASAVECC